VSVFAPYAAVVGGWVKTGRVADKGALCFLELNDGTGPVNLQVGGWLDTAIWLFCNHPIWLLGCLVIVTTPSWCWLYVTNRVTLGSGNQNTFS
jgi:hypothetical protein